MSSLRGDLETLARGWRWGRRPLVPRSVDPPPQAERDFPTGWARTGVGVAARALLQRYALSPLVRLETQVRVEGLDVLEDLGPPVIFVANHSSHLDAPLVLTSLPTAWRARTATGAAADYFFDVWWRAAATALVFNAFPVERAGSHQQRGRTTRLARELLAAGWNLLVFPEGTRSRDGWVRDLRLGAARLAAEGGAAVVPVALRGTYQAMPRGAGWPAKGRPPVVVRFGRPVRPGPGESPVDFNARIRAALAATLDEDRTTWWEALGRAEKGETPSLHGPVGPRWLRTWEGSRPIARRGARQAWR